MADVTREISVDAPLPKVFEAISTTAGIRGWWTDDCAYDGKLAGRCQLVFGAPPTTLDLETTIFCRDEEVLWRCMNGPEDWMGTNISWVVEPRASGTKLVLSHSGTRITDATRPALDAMWRALLDSLKRYAESGTPAPLWRRA